MSTTAVIVELLIIGLFTSFWVLLLCLRFSEFDLDVFKNQFSQASDWSAPLIVIAIAVFYQIGLLMNAVSYRVTKKLASQVIRDEIIPDVNYEFVRATVYQKGSADLLRDLGLYLSFVRLARSGTLNFFIIAISISLFGGRWIVVGIISLLLAIVTFFVWRNVFNTYYKRMKFAYQVITKEKPAPANVDSDKSDAVPNNAMQPTPLHAASYDQLNVGAGDAKR